MRSPDVHFSPAPTRVIEEMLRIARVGPDDVVFDLGCGDGRILTAAAQKFGARGVGIDMDARLLAECLGSARALGVENLLEFREQDFFETDLQPASVLALYLLDTLNIRLRPRILAQCRPGTRVVTYSFEMGEWEPDEYTPIAANGVMMWIVPANVSGTWTSSGGGIGEMTIQQKFQNVSGSAVVDGEITPIHNGKVSGSEITFAVKPAGEGAPLEIRAHLHDDVLQGVVVKGGVPESWSAKRVPGSCCPLEISPER